MSAITSKTIYECGGCEFDTLVGAEAYLHEAIVLTSRLTGITTGVNDVGVRSR